MKHVPAKQFDSGRLGPKSDLLLVHLMHHEKLKEVKILII
jgi:hypothetical protein